MAIIEGIFATIFACILFKAFWGFEKEKEEKCVVRKLVYLDKKLIDVNNLFNETIDGRHTYVRKWVFLNAKERYDEDAIFGFSGAVRTEMTALGVETTIRELLPVYFEGSSGLLDAVEGNDEPLVILVQRTGFFPLALVFGMHREKSCELTVNEASQMVKIARLFAIADLNS